MSSKSEKQVEGKEIETKTLQPAQNPCSTSKPPLLYHKWLWVHLRKIQCYFTESNTKTSTSQSAVVLGFKKI